MHNAPGISAGLSEGPVESVTRVWPLLGGPHVGMHEESALEAGSDLLQPVARDGEGQTDSAKADA
ncbi:hypothetical protein VPG91_11455 [Nitrospirillum amazonense]|uniref:hypothetical protein n=1 Tax=Nitrospirillum amazonense TaxID=28077 RepID=UPI002DD451ED|nr:hypothetical protein [Nitrospirillum amazonense]MEC4591605.1 hypothetical protein [Nitrospirillum amazonense]